MNSQISNIAAIAAIMEVTGETRYSKDIAGDTIDCAAFEADELHGETAQYVETHDEIEDFLAAGWKAGTRYFEDGIEVLCLARGKSEICLVNCGEHRIVSK